MKIKIYLSNIDIYNNEFYIDNALININNTIEAFNKLIEDNNIKVNEYIDTLCKIYNIKITNQDLLRISSIILEENSKCTILDTDIVTEITKRIENKNCFEYIKEKHNLNILVAFTDNNIITNKDIVKEIT